MTHADWLEIMDVLFIFGFGLMFGFIMGVSARKNGKQGGGTV